MYNKEIAKRCFEYEGSARIKNIRYVPRYLKSIWYLIRHGYDEFATWEVGIWFTRTMRSILNEYNRTRVSTPILVDDFPYIGYDTEEGKAIIEQNDKMWDDIMDRMLYLIDAMDDENEMYENCEYDEKDRRVEEAKDEFFKLFSKYYFYIWS